MGEPTSGALRWGVLGASSRIYRGKILPPLEASPRHVVVAEASRDADGSEAPYAALLARDDVDAVYIPLPNHGHKPWILAALEAGKHVLCEKPLTMSVADTDEVYAAAEAAGRVLVEAYMWPHHPRNQALLEAGAHRTGRACASPAVRSPSRWDGRTTTGSTSAAAGRCSTWASTASVRHCCWRPVSRFGSLPSAVRNEQGVDVSLSGWLDLGEGFVATCEVSFESVYGRSFILLGHHGPDQHPRLVRRPVRSRTARSTCCDSTSRCTRSRRRAPTRTATCSTSSPMWCSRCTSPLGSRRESAARPVDRGVAHGCGRLSGRTPRVAPGRRRRW